MIKTKNIGYSVNGRRLVMDVSLRIAKGRLLAIVGPNGAGKSTLLKLLTRDLSPDTGTIRFHGTDIRKYSHLELAKKRAVLTQQNHLSLSFEVHEVVMMGRYPYHKDVPGERDYEIVEECLKRVGMLQFADRIFPTLSGGEQQRVQLARSLVQIWDAPDSCLFLDEPTNGMDLQHQYHALDIARELTAKGVAVVAVLHDLNMALQYADEVMIMHQGTMKYFGAAEAVLTPENIAEVFGVCVQLIKLPDSKNAVIVPLSSAWNNQNRYPLTK